MKEKVDGGYVKESNRVEQKDYISVAGFGQSGREVWTAIGWVGG